MATGRYSQADLVAMIPLYLDGELADDERSAVEAYLAEHPEAVADFAQAARLIDLLDETITPRPTDDAFVDEVMAQVRQLSTAQRWWHRFGLTPTLTRLRWALELGLLVVLAQLFWLHPWAPSVSPVECRLLAENQWLLGRPVAVRVLLRDRGHDKPLTGAQVRLVLAQGHRRATLAELRTNGQGSVDAGLTLPAEFEPGNATLYAHVQSPWGWAGTALALDLQRRTVYRVDPAAARVPAGCDLVARVQAVDAGSGRPVGGQTVPWLLLGRGVRLASGSVTLSDHGQALLRVPTSRYLSPQPVTLQLGDEPRCVRRLALTPALGEALTCRVETAERYVVAGQMVRGAVLASTSGGTPSAGASVAIDLRVGDAVASASGQLDDAGRWDFSLPAPGFSQPGLALLDARVTSVDAEQGWAEARLAAAPRAVVLALDAGVTGLVAGLDNPLAFTAQRPDGSPVLANIDAWFNDQHASLWTDSQGRATLSVQPRVGANRLQLRAETEGRRYDQEFALTAADGRAALAVQTAAVGDSRSVYVTVRATESMTGPAYLDLLADGRSISARSLSLTRGSGGLVMEVPRGVAGRLLLRAYAPGTRSGWRTGFARVDVPSQSDLRISVARRDADDSSVSVRCEDGEGRPKPAQLLLFASPKGVAAMVASTGVSRPPAWREPMAPDAPLAAANSYHEAQARALGRQTAYFKRAPWVATGVGALVLLIALLWLVQTYRDPYEYVPHAERHRWGRVPQVHRRGAWAGYGLLAIALLVAGAVAGGLRLAGNQARGLAESAVAPAPNWYPRLDPPPPLDTVDAAASTERWLPSGVGPGSLLNIDSSGQSLWRWPAHSGLWQVRAEALAADGQAAITESLLPAPARLAVSVDMPDQVCQGDRLSVPVTIANPLDLAVPAVLTASAENGLDLASAPTQRVLLPRGGRLRLNVPVVAVEAGRAKLRVRAQSADLTAEQDCAVDVVPSGPRVQRCRTGTLDDRQTVTLDVPAAAAGRRLDLQVWADPRAPLDQALSRAVRRPAFTADEAAAQAEAAALRLSLARGGGATSDAQRDRLLPDAQRAAQRLLTFEAHDGKGLATGGFAPSAGLPPSKLLTARVLVALREVGNYTDVDPALLLRTRHWLGSKQQTGSGLWLAEGPALGLDQPDSGLRTAALVITSLAGLEGTQAERVAAAASQLTERVAGAGDAYTLVAAAQALQALDRAEAARPILGKLVNLRDDRPEGASWYPGPQPVATGATGRGAAVETTALVVQALTAARMAPAVARSGADWLRHRQQPDGTWGSVRATVAAVRALVAVDPAPGAARGAVTVTLAGAKVGGGSLDPDSGANSVVTLASPAPGAQPLVISFSGRGRPAWSYRLAYNPVAPEPQPSGFGVSASWSANRVAPGGEVTATLRVRNTGNQAVPAVTAMLPIPAGFAPAQALASRDGDAVRLAIGTLAPNQVAEVSVRLRARADAAEITPPPVVVEATYDPSTTQTVMLPKMTIG
ncbi:MAG: DUF11 domain-containing protein [Armatimonadetes bacterium]|nr:DUF11 domain-containing protein [Armatimonadota bacterium]